MRSKVATATIAVLTLGVTAACGGDSGGSGDTEATGPIKVWLSNNPEEIAWGKQMVKAWNAEHPDEKVTAQEIPAGKTSEEVIGAAITAGNAPCLVFNTSPAAVPQFQKQGGLVALDTFDGGTDYVESRSGDVAEQYKSPDGQFYQIPWKSNPVMIFYNKDIMKKAGVDPENPPLATYDEFLATSKKIVDSGAAEAAIWPAPTSEFFQSWFDFYPLYAAETGGTQLVEDERGHLRLRRGQERHATSGRRCTTRGCPRRRSTTATPSPTRRPRWRSSAPGRSRSTATRSTGAPSRSRPPPAPAPEETHTFSDAKNIGLYSACENQGTAWEVLKFATSEEQDGKLLEMTGQMPLRTDLESTYADYFKSHPEYVDFADQASRTVEVPNVANSIEIWQDVPRRVLVVGDLRQVLDRRRALGRVRQGHRPRRSVLSRSPTTMSAQTETETETADRTPPARSRSRLATLLGRQPLGIVFAAPYAVFLAVVFAYPLGLAVWISFHDYFFAAPGAEVERPFVGLENYRTVLDDPAVRESFGNVALFLVINVPLTVVLSLVLAAALNGAIRGRAFLRVAYFVAVRDRQRRAGGGVAVPLQPGRDGQPAARAAGAGPVLAGEQQPGDAGDRAVRDLEAARHVGPALPGGAAERAEGALRVRLHRRRRTRRSSSGTSPFPGSGRRPRWC